MVVVGLALGVGLTVVLGGGGSGPPTQSNQGPSVTRFSFTDGVLAPVSPGEAATPSAGPAEEPPTAEAAVAMFLQSAVDGKPEASYALLDPASRQRFPTAAAWTRAQANLTIPTGFEIGPSRAAFGGGDRVEVEVTSSQQPSLDPTRGLVPALSRGLWSVERRDGVWRVAAEPVSVAPILPDEAGAPVAVTQWVDRLRACDLQGAASLQVGTYLYGPADFVRAPCQEAGAWTVGATTGLDSAADPRDFVAAFGADAGTWARLVAVQGPRTDFFAVVAPMGEAWQVVGVADRS